MRSTVLTRSTLTGAAIALILSVAASGPAAASQTELVIMVTPRILIVPKHRIVRITGFGTFSTKQRSRRQTPNNGQEGNGQ